MLVILRESALSIVESKGDPSMLVVRAWFPGDIERAFGRIASVAVHKVPHAEYKFAAAVPRRDVERMLAKAVVDVEYPAFRAAFAPTWRRALLARVFSIFCRERDMRSKLEQALPEIAN